MVKEPDDPTEETRTVKGMTVTEVSKFQEMVYAESIKQWIRDDKSLQATTRSLYYIVMGQCSKLMKNKLTLSKEYTRFEEEGDVTALLNEIRRVSLQIETNMSIYDAMNKAKALFFSYKQEQSESNAKHLRHLKSIVEAIEHLGG